MITAIGAVAIEVGVLVWSASTATALGFPLALIVALLSGQTRRAYRLQAEQSAALLAQVEQLRAEQRQVAVLNERTRIAREIHDVLAHSLGALGIQLQAARAVLSDQRDVDRALGLLDQAQRIAGDGLGETRRAIHALRSGAGPLPQELTRLAEAYHTRHQMPVTVSINGDVRTLPPDAALALLRTAQESLVNAAKHGDGHAAGINLSFDAGQTTLTVASPLAGEHSEAEAEAGAGTGAGAGALRSPMETADSGYGLMGLRERLLLLGGTLTAGPRDGSVDRYRAGAPVSDTAGPAAGPRSGDALRIIVADDQASVREGLAVMLDLLPGIEVVASAANGQQALDLVAEHHPDAILLDLHMPGMDGTEAARLLTARHPEVAIVVLTTYADDSSILAALRAGARGYLTKDADRAAIAQALHGAASGLSVLAQSVHATLLSAAAAPPADLPGGAAGPPGHAGELPAGLTPREAEILTMIARDMTNAEIAGTLALSNHTIKTHINRIFAKTGSANRAEASRFARAHGLT